MRYVVEDLALHNLRKFVPYTGLNQICMDRAHTAEQLKYDLITHSGYSTSLL